MMMNPLMTIPAQLAANRQVMGGMPITQFDELGGKHMLKDYGKWAISQFACQHYIILYLCIYGEIIL
jgi:hypothetical protein